MRGEIIKDVSRDKLIDTTTSYRDTEEFGDLEEEDQEHFINSNTNNNNNEEYESEEEDIKSTFRKRKKE